MPETPKNLFQKIQEIKCELMDMNLKKSWRNNHAWFDYYELADILPAIVKLCKEHKVFTRIVFNNENAVLELVNIENPIETATYTSPMREIELRWCQPIQALWAVETYQRRYLFLNSFDIVEADTLDAVAWDEKKSEVKTATSTAPTQWFNKEELEKLKASTDWLKSFKTSDDLIKSVETKYRVSKEMKLKIADARAEVD